MPGELAQVRVEHETRIAQRRGPQALQRRDVQPLEHRIDCDALSAAQHVPEPHRHTVDDDQIHLGVRNACRLDRVLDRTAAVDADREHGLAQPRPEEVVQLFVEAELGARVCHVLRPRPEPGGVLRSHQKVATPQGEGELTSGTYSPTLKRSIALARLPLGVEAGARAQVSVRDKQLAAKVVQPPFVRRGKILVD